MRAFPLAQQTDGINRGRIKGGAAPSSLYDAKNCYVDKNGTLCARPGLVNVKTFPAGTKGVVGFEGKFHTFAATPTASIDPDIVVHVLRHPTGGVAPLLTIHRAFPFLAKLYVVAEFTDNVVQHYWLDVTIAWTALTVKPLGSRVTPVAENGFYYANLTQDLSTDVWTANNEVTVGEFRQPSTPGNFRFEVTAVTGTAPIRTSNTEPTWPTTDGATVVERRYVTESQVDPGSEEPPEEPTNDPYPGSPDDAFYPYGRGKSTGDV